MVRALGSPDAVMHSERSRAAAAAAVNQGVSPEPRLQEGLRPPARASGAEATSGSSVLPSAPHRPGPASGALPLWPVRGDSRKQRLEAWTPQEGRPRRHLEPRSPLSCCKAWEPGWSQQSSSDWGCISSIHLLSVGGGGHLPGPQLPCLHDDGGQQPCIRYGWRPCHGLDRRGPWVRHQAPGTKASPPRGKGRATGPEFPGPHPHSLCGLG